MSDARTKQMDLEPIHREAADAAKSYFSGNRVQSDSGEEDEELLAQLDRWTADSNNNAAVLFTFNVYKSCMNQLTDLPCVAVDLLNMIHDKARLEAVSRFNVRRSKQTKYQQDEYKRQLDEVIANHIQRLRALNEMNNDFAVSKAMDLFNRIMMELCAPSALCLHPAHIRREFENAKDEALTFFRRKRTRNDDDDSNDTFIKKISTRATDLYTETYVQINRRKNEEAVDTAMILFYRFMEETNDTAIEFTNFLRMLTPMPIPLLDEPWMTAPFATLTNETRARIGESIAKLKFMVLRKSPPPQVNCDDDQYMDSLQRAINAAKANYRRKAIMEDVQTLKNQLNIVMLILALV